MPVPRGLATEASGFCEGSHRRDKPGVPEGNPGSLLAGPRERGIQERERKDRRKIPTPQWSAGLGLLWGPTKGSRVLYGQMRTTLRPAPSLLLPMHHHPRPLPCTFLRPGKAQLSPSSMTTPCWYTIYGMGPACELSPGVFRVVIFICIGKMCLDRLGGPELEHLSGGGWGAVGSICSLFLGGGEKSSYFRMFVRRQFPLGFLQFLVGRGPNAIFLTVIFFHTPTRTQRTVSRRDPLNDNVTPSQGPALPPSSSLLGVGDFRISPSHLFWMPALTLQWTCCQLSGRSSLTGVAGRIGHLQGGLDFLCDVCILGSQPNIQAGRREEIL